MNAQLREIRERAQARLVESVADRMVSGQPTPIDLQRDQTAAVITSGGRLCSECRSHESANALDGSGRCSGCAS